MRAHVPVPDNDDSAHGARSVPEWLAEARAELARAKAAAAPHPAENRPIPAPVLVTAAQGKEAEVVVGGVVGGEGHTSPSRIPSVSTDCAPTKPWEDASEHEREIFINRALTAFGRSFAISINFDPVILAAANDNARGVLDYLRRRVLRHLKRTIGARPCWIKLETTRDEKVHLHGGVALNDNDDPREVERIVAQAGGNHSCQGSKPADVREMWCPDGWVGYCGKSEDRTRRHLREALGLNPNARVPLYSATDDIRALAKELHQEARRAAQAARGRPIAVEVPQSTPEAAKPVSEPRDVPAPASRSRSRPTTMPMMPLPIPAVANRVGPVMTAWIWKALIGILTTAHSSRPTPSWTPWLLGVASQIVLAVIESPFRRSTGARSRGPPRGANGGRRCLSLPTQPVSVTID